MTKRHDRRRKLRSDLRAAGVPENDLERQVRLALAELERRDAARLAAIFDSGHSSQVDADNA
jgi:hypothetical protein